ncbi:RICIN domain-containing protein [Streptomyces sp. NBC_01498]|uniref:RICIN domain-containing protein n=1 Tax=Streptomyces sp. NBC_01498 TaxID=2975870 RepID=UPI002E7C1795|nr:RICIN domain-containing protein [Streptomyces sp. NBC_01498]WTL28262.1 RICIN domain-containing protein [Streptomyces sp. NBC_01498]
MQDPRTSRTTPPPPAGRPVPRPEGPDAELVAALRTGDSDEEDHATALLLARHWGALLDYAEIRSPSADAASMLATAAFGTVLDALRRPGPVPALRPEFLVTARHTAGVWAAEGQRTDNVWEHPGHFTDTGAGHPDGPQAPENRRLALHSFRSMPAPARTLLWHTEVEAEPLSVPATLLGIDPEMAPTELEHARELFRTGCVRAHIHLAPDSECRHYNRLLDVSLRRGGPLLPDIQQHLAICAHCAYATEQFVHSAGRPAALLAEALLGPHARRYLDTRPGRRGRSRSARAGARRGGRHSVGGRPRVLPRVTVLGKRVMSTPGRPRTVLLSGLGLVTVGLFAVTVTSLSSGDRGGQAIGPAVPIGTGSSPTATDPGSQGVSGPGGQPPSGAQDQRPDVLRTALRSADADLCLDLRDTRPDIGSEATLAICSSSADTQRWQYEDDGLLRSGADDDLCLNSHTVDGSLVLGLCAPPGADDAADVRYDLTPQGQVVPRWDDSLAVVPTTPVAGTSVVAKIRDGSSAQNWSTDAPRDSPRSLPVVGGGRPTAPPEGPASVRRSTIGSERLTERREERRSQQLEDRQEERRTGGRGCETPADADNDVRGHHTDRSDDDARSREGAYDRDRREHCDDTRFGD